MVDPNIYRRRYAAKHREQLNAYHRAYRLKNLAKMRAYNKEYARKWRAFKRDGTATLGKEES